MKIGLVLTGKNVPVLDFLGVKTGEVEITGVVEEGEENPRYLVYTCDTFNRIVGLAALDHGLDIVETGAPFIKEYGSGFAPDIAAIAKKVGAKKFDVQDMGGYSFEIDPTEPGHGHFKSTFGGESGCVRSFEDALSILIAEDTGKEIPAPVAAALLKQVVAADLPIKAPPRRRIPTISMIVIGG